MAKNKTDTYKQAKSVLETLELRKELSIELTKDKIPIFRKHLSEILKRTKSKKKFYSRIVDNQKLRIIRID